MSGVRITRSQLRKRTKKALGSTPCWVIWRDEDMRWMAEFNGDFYVELEASSHEELMANINFIADTGPAEAN